MTVIDIFSGFLGAGKTTLIKKLIREAYQGEQIVLIENEFGEIGIDGGFLQDAGIVVNEMNSGCICCSLVGDFGKALTEVIRQYHPHRILIEPSGVGKLSDVAAAVKRVTSHEVVLGACVTVVDANKCKIYLKNFGEFYSNQVEHASAVVLSRTDSISEEKLSTALELLRGLNGDAVIVTTPWDQLDGKQLLESFDKGLNKELEQLLHETAHHHHEHHHHEHDCCDHEHHHHEHDCCEHEHHHHEHDCCEHEHHHHHADEVFQSWGLETPKKFSRDDLEEILRGLEKTKLYGQVLRAKGIVPTAEGVWLHFDYVPGDYQVREGCAAVTGRLCVIGAGLNTQNISRLFGV